jgi:hypothetical protein
MFIHKSATTRTNQMTAMTEIREPYMRSDVHFFDAAPGRCCVRFYCREARRDGMIVFDNGVRNIQQFGSDIVLNYWPLTGHAREEFVLTIRTGETWTVGFRNTWMARRRREYWFTVEFDLDPFSGELANGYRRETLVPEPAALSTLSSLSTIVGQLAHSLWIALVSTPLAAVFGSWRDQKPPAALGCE